MNLLSTDLCKIIFSYNFCKLFPSQRFTTIKVETTLEIGNLQYIFVCMCSGNVYLFILDKKSPKKLNIVRERVIFNIFLFACPSAIFTFLYWTKKIPKKLNIVGEHAKQSYDEKCLFPARWRINFSLIDEILHQSQ